MENTPDENEVPDTHAHVYIVECADGSLYTGYARDVDERIRTHNAGKGAKYTRSRLPVHKVYEETLPDKSQALKREAAIKKLTRKEKLELIRSGHFSFR